MPRYVCVSDLAAAGVRAARIHSLERSLYIVELDTPSGSAWLGSDAETRAVFRNISAAREALALVGALSITLVHASAFDEMVGLGPRADNTIEVPLSNQNP